MDDNRNRQAEIDYQILYDHEEQEPPRVPYHIRKYLPGGNLDLPVVDTLEAPPEFWSRSFVKYILSIIDETKTNGWRLQGSTLESLADESELGSMRARYLRLSLIAQGATVTTTEV